MKSIKALSVAALVALTATAFVGATLARAESTALCGIDESPCSTNNQVTHIHLVATKATLLTAIVNAECSALFLGETSASLAAPLVIKGAFTLSNCSHSCTVTEENGPAEISLLRTGHEAASVLGKILVHISCSSLLNCKYVGENLEGFAKGPLLAGAENGENSLLEQVMTNEGGFFCPKTARLDIAVSSLFPLYIAQ